MKLRTVNRLIRTKNDERDRLTREIASLRQAAISDLQSIHKLETRLTGESNRANSIARELDEARAQLVETVKQYRAAERELANLQPEPVLGDETWLQGLPAKERQKLKEGFLDSKVKEGAEQRNGHTQVALKCACGLEFIILTWFPSEHGAKRNYHCPECGETMIGYLGERHVEHEIKDQMIRCGNKAYTLSAIAKNARRGNPASLLQPCGPTIITDVATVKAELAKRGRAAEIAGEMKSNIFSLRCDEERELFIYQKSPELAAWNRYTTQAAYEQACERLDKGHPLIGLPQLTFGKPSGEEN